MGGRVSSGKTSFVIAIWDRSGIKGERIHKRIELLQDGQAKEVVETFLSLVPEGRRAAQASRPGPPARPADSA